MKDRCIVVGVSGGISAYRVGELVRLLVKGGARVQVAMTEAATHFVAPLTFQALSGHPVACDLLHLETDQQAGHIELAQSAEAVVIAPTTADLISRLSSGRANDFPTAVVLASTCPVLLAPAMESAMWENPFTQGNIKRLLETGRFHTVGPEVGQLLTGRVGVGRMAEPLAIIAALERLLGPADLKGERVIVTSGPTREPLDPVRFISNRSSGRMGHACARAAAMRGAEVDLISGPTSLAAPPGVSFIAVETAEEMCRAVLARLPRATVLIKAAAVADYRPVKRASRKLKRKDARMTLELAPTTDILARVRSHLEGDGPRRNEAPRSRQAQGPSTREVVVVGFAAETHDLERHARKKLKAKGLDLLVANDVTAKGAGFDAETNLVHLMDSGGKVEKLPLMSKLEVAHRVLDRVVEILKERRA